MHTFEPRIQTILSSSCPSGIKALIFLYTPSSLSCPKGDHKNCPALQCLNELFQVRFFKVGLSRLMVPYKSGWTLRAS